MPEMTPSTRELARRIGVTETALRKAEAKGRIEREPALSLGARSENYIRFT